MLVLAVVTYAVACWLVYPATDPRCGRRVARGASFAILVLFGVPVLLSALRVRFGSFGAVHAYHLALIALYAVLAILLPSSLLRSLGKERAARIAAVILALLAPLAGHFFAERFGARPALAGHGSWTELCFLDPLAMWQGVTQEGVVAHRYRLPLLVLVGVAGAALALHCGGFLQERSRASSADPLARARAASTPPGEMLPEAAERRLQRDWPGAAEKVPSPGMSRERVSRTN